MGFRQLKFAFGLIKKSMATNASDSGSSCSKRTKQSRAKFLYQKDSEESLNRQINKEFSAGYLYLSMASTFSSDAVALPGFHRMYTVFAKEEIDHAMMLVDFQSKRGGKLNLLEIPAPPNDIEWTALSSVSAALEEEKKSLLEIVEEGEKHKDAHLVDFITTEFLPEQYASLKKLGDLITQIETVQNGIGIYIIDLELFKIYSSDNKK